jgi:hypothetical protein
VILSQITLQDHFGYTFLAWINSFAYSQY